MRHLTLRARATAVGTFAVAVLLVAGAFLLVATLENRLTTASDELIKARLSDLTAQVRAGGVPESVRSIDDNSMAQVVRADGVVLVSSSNLPATTPVADLPATDQPQATEMRAPDDGETETYRVWYVLVQSQGTTMTVYVGSSLESVREASATLRHTLTVAVPVTVAALALVMWLLIGLVLRRLDRIRAEVDQISQDSLHRRIQARGPDDEVGRLTATMNAMLARLEASAKRQHEFIADVSHDLQSPLAVQRLALELALERPDSIDSTVLRSDVLGATRDMERMVRDLLLLASLDEAPVPEPAFVDLDQIALEEATRLRIDSAIVVDTSGVSAAPVRVADDDVRRIVRNLLDNAAKHGAAHVRLVVDSGEGTGFLDVLDDGPGIPESIRPHVFERFVRGDDARTHGQGSGLGLAIARGLAERNGGTLMLLASEQGAHFRLVFGTPAVPPATPPR